MASPAASDESLPDWDLTPYFEAPEADDYRAFRRGLEADLDALQERASALRPVARDAAGWADWLCALEDAEARFAHLHSFLSCWTSADSADERGQRERASLAVLFAAIEKLRIAMQAALRAVDDAGFAALVDDPRVAPVRYALERSRRDASRRMAPELEALGSDLGVDGIGAWGRLYDRISGTLRFELCLDGQPPATHPVSMARTLLEDADARVRRAAMEGSARAWESVAEPVAACLNAIAGTRLTLYERRGIGHFLEPALFDSGIEQATLDTMFETVRARQELARRFLRRKARLLGRERLGFQDRMAPLVGAGDASGSAGDADAEAARISWEEARGRVEEAFGRTYPELRALAERAFDGRWIDYRPRAAKRPGGFCTGSSLLEQSRIFMTFNGASGDVQTLAHELGHAFHASLMRGMRHWQRDYPMTLAETASTFAEKLVTDAALAEPGLSRAARARLLDARLQDAEAFLLDIPMRFDFEVGLYTARASGELSVRELKERMLEAQRANYADALEPAELDPWFWASKLHFYITELSFYNFPYTFGYLFSMGLFARAKAEGPAFLPRYEALLRATGSAPAEQVASDALGVDLREPGFWDASLDLVEADLDEFLAVTETL